jgi:aminoglycoside/choline kinase family phosphotransferase
MDQIIALLQEHNLEYGHISQIAQSGGDRQYYLVHLADTQKIIGTVSINEKENDAFFSFQKVFAANNIPVPKIIAQSTNKQAYLQSFAGESTLLDVLLKIGYTPDTFILYKDALKHLAKCQIIAGAQINFKDCVAAQQFDYEAALFDLNYCITYYAAPLGLQYNAALLEKDFKLLAQEVADIQPQYFMYRDFQGRNIMVNEQYKLCFIDFQGGMRGPLQYDVASLLWQAKAALPADWKEDLLTYYYNTSNALLHNKLDKTIFFHNYYLIVLMRIMQVLGAYGRRGLQEKKQHFIESIPHAIENLKTWKSYATITTSYPAISELIEEIINNKEAYKKLL